MEIITATIEDISLIQALSAEAWPKAFAGILSEEQIRYMMEMMYSTEALEKQIGEQGHIFLLAKEGSDYLGYLAYETDYENGTGTKVHKIYLLPSAQGKGVGRALIEKAVEIARTAENTHLLLNVNRENRKAIGFYERMGFTIDHREDNDIGGGFWMIDYVMTKPL